MSLQDGAGLRRMESYIIAAHQTGAVGRTYVSACHLPWLKRTLPRPAP